MKLVKVERMDKKHCSDGIKSYREKLLEEAKKIEKWNERIDTIQTACHMFGGSIVIISGLYLYMFLVCMIAGTPAPLKQLAILGGINCFGWLLIAM